MFYAALFNLWHFLHIISYFYLLVCVFACVLVCVGVYFICFYLAHIHSKTFFNYIMHFRYAFRILICLYIHNIESLIVCLVFGFCFCFWYFFFVFFRYGFCCLLFFCIVALLLFLRIQPKPLLCVHNRTQSCLVHMHVLYYCQSLL